VPVNGETERPSIYVAVGRQRDLSHGGGDVLNEIKMYRRLGELFDVYYNGQPLRWNEPNFGIRPAQLQIPSEPFDYYYIRNNPELAASVRKNLLIMAYPYEPELWHRASGLVVTTEAWRRLLQNFNSLDVPPDWRTPWYPPRIVEPPPIILAEQSIAEGFKPRPDHALTKAYRARFGLGFRIGFIGRLDPSCYPYEAIDAVAELRRESRQVALIFIGRQRDVHVSDWIQVWRSVPHEEMMYVTSSFDCLLYDQDPTGNWFGSAKVLEAMACGVPILTRRSEARVEQLSSDYPLFYSNRDEALNRLRQLFNDQDFRTEVRTHLLRRAKHYSHEAVTARFRTEIQSFMSAG